MVSFTKEESDKLYELGLNLDFNLDFISSKIDLSCYKSCNTIYHLQIDGEESEFDNFYDMLEEIKTIIVYDKEIEQIANTFKSYDEMFSDLLDHGLSSLSHPIEIDWMLEYFTGLEDYEKCSLLIDFKNQINKK